MFSVHRPIPLLVVVLLHVAFFGALHSGLKHRPDQQPRLHEVFVRLIQPAQPVPVSEPKIEPPKPKPVVKQTPRPKPETPVKPITTPLPMPVTESITPVEPNPVPVAEPSPAPTAPVISEPISTPRFDAAYLNNPAPIYPSMSRRMGEEGKVTLRVFVNDQGKASEVYVRTSSGSPRLDEAALQAVRSWRFIPAKQGDRAITAWVIVPISFRLDE